MFIFFLLTIIVVLVMTWVIYGSFRRTPRPNSGASFFGESLIKASWHNKKNNDNSRIRVGTYNINGRKSFRTKSNVDCMINYLKNLDVIALNEVKPIVPDFKNAAKILGNALGMSYLFCPSDQRWGRDRVGNAVLSSLPITYWQQIPLRATESKKPRNIILISLPLGATSLKILITHTHTKGRDRISQLQTVQHLFAALEPPVILLGDLNSTPESEIMQSFLNIPDIVDPLKFCNDRVDWILSRGLIVTDSGMNPAGPSDHPQFWVEFELT